MYMFMLHDTYNDTMHLYLYLYLYVNIIIIAWLVVLPFAKLTIIIQSHDLSIFN